MKTRDVMTRDVRTCAPETPLDVVGGIMWDCACGAILVVDPAETPLGIITDRDISIASSLQHRPLWELRASDVYDGRELITCRDVDDVGTVLKELSAHRVRRLPVVDRTGRLRGIVSLEDLVVHADRGRRGEGPPELSYEDVMVGFKQALGHPAQKGGAADESTARAAPLGARGGSIPRAAREMAFAGAGLLRATARLFTAVVAGVVERLARR